ncbi:Uncharacterized protein SCF082_LOCUS51933 [Durusdinium trenchii]|uniref:Uncharacterized protein n=1 Tax=Durusdinium trenchii TaxID=1381693 RepID=A0ABP0SIB5_9DINO
MEFHLRVPPERWCITKAEFFAFIADVREIWERERGTLPGAYFRLSPASTATTIRSRMRTLTGLAEEVDGPNLYQVNDHYVKPLTLAAGGMSYALMKHPEGLLCQVFISHAWAEGIFELGDQVKRAWPRLQLLRNLYCCLLANPQNLDMRTWLNVPPEQSPFARAMQSASHVLIIPNSTVSIYTRLWCVYEAYLGTRYEKTCIMPTRPKSSAQCLLVVWSILLPLILGAALGLILVLIPINQEVLWKVCLATFVCCFLLTVLTFAVSVALQVCKRRCKRLVHQNLNLLRFFHMTVLWLLSSIILPWVKMPGPYYTPSKFDHYFVMIGTWLFNLLRVAQLNEELLEDRELARQATNLNFVSLVDATCTNSVDEARIRQSISGFERDVELAIHILMKAGAYDHSLRKAFESGANIRGLGTTDLVVKTGVATLLWLLCGAHCIAVFILHDDRGCFEDMPRATLEGHISVIICFVVAGLVPIMSFVAERSGPERGVFAANVWIMAATFALGIPALCEIGDWLARDHFIWLFETNDQHKYCPGAFANLQGAIHADMVPYNHRYVCIWLFAAGARVLASFAFLSA